MSEKFQAVVIGGGPGGYVCAIRLAQLGLKTACIESRGSLGGTCLNVGCIPSKSLLNLSEEFHKVKNLSNKGIEVSEVKLNLPKMMKRKEKAVTVLTKGVEFLLKKNKVTYFRGTGSFKSEREILIKDNTNKEITIQTEKVIIATGSVPYLVLYDLKTQLRALLTQVETKQIPFLILYNHHLRQPFFLALFLNLKLLSMKQ